jgi:transposase-like protein
MTYQPHCTLPEELLEQIADGGLAALPDALRLLLNAAMLCERQQFIGAGPYERSVDRHAHANGFKDKTVQPRLGALTVAVPPVRDGGFYPQRLEQGGRSERALTLALAEM